MRISKKKFEVTKIFPPYIKMKSGALGCSLQKDGRGVYIIYEKRAGSYKPIYVGQSCSSLYNTIYRHFQKWTDRRSSFTKSSQVYERVTYKSRNFNPSDFGLKVWYCGSVDEILALEQYFIKKIKPRDNTLKIYLLSKADEAHIEGQLRGAEVADPF